MELAAESLVEFPSSWYPLCRSTDVRPGKVVRQEAFGMPLAIFRTPSLKVGALYARCTHMGADLGRGRVVRERLQCPLHHWEYGREGRCEHIPGSCVIPRQVHQAALVCEEHYGLVFGFLGGEPTFPFPRFAGEEPGLYSRVSVMSFVTPYQVLAANSFDSQHFVTVHHRRLLEPPTLASESAFHLSIRFRAQVEGSQFHDRLLRRIGVDQVELSAHCWGGNTILAYNTRTGARILFTILPIDARRSRIFILNVMGQETAAAFPRALRRLLLSAMHGLTVAFLKPDIAVMQDLQWKLGVLLPDLDGCFLEWIRYWKALPTSPLTVRGSRCAREHPQENYPLE
ncbi:MAG: Rieske 2Fe-2S domain-containing protein [Thermoanaerobaculia bacterium]